MPQSLDGTAPRRKLRYLRTRDLFFDWNEEDPTWRQPPFPVELNDETLRDGLQSPSVMDPPVEQKIELLHLMDELGIDSADVGYPGSHEKAMQDVVRLAREVQQARLKVTLNACGRTHADDIRATAEAQQRAGVEITAAMFLGSSPIRQFAEGWDMARLMRTTEEAVTLAVSLGLDVMYVTEDTTRARPEHVEQLYRLAVECGASRVCVSDTVGHATPWGVQRLISFVRQVVDGVRPGVKLDFHGHRDRGLDVANALASLQAGANRIHGCALGMGERVGNASMDLLLVNLQLLGWINRDLSRLADYARVAHEATGVPFPVNYPVLGKDAFETSTGVHAAAIMKARARGEAFLADRVYSGIPASMIGRHQVISIGPMSGAANVRYWLAERCPDADPACIEAVLQAAKRSGKVLTEDEVWTLVAPFNGASPARAA